VRVTSLWIYPVKSCRGIAVERAVLSTWGLEHDRRFLVVDERGRFVTQRDTPRLATLETAIEHESLRLSCGDFSTDVPLEPRGPDVQVGVWGRRLVAQHVASADDFLAATLGRRLRLVYAGPETAPFKAGSASAYRTAFADRYPLLVVGQGSLDDLNARLATPVPMARFRPNLVFDGGAPFVEDHWRDVDVGATQIRHVQACGRCVVVSTDQRSGTRGKEPLATLATYRKEGNEVLFGMNAVPRRPGTIDVGDVVTPRIDARRHPSSSRVQRPAR
jgi:uncharacterized protein YcbX